MSKQDADDYYGGLVRDKVPPTMGARMQWDNMLQADIFEIVIGPFKTKELMEKYASKLRSS